MTINNMYVLDRNIVDLMKKYNNNTNITDEKRIHMLEYLTEMDKDGNLFSPTFSFLEGKIKTIVTEENRLIMQKIPNKEIRSLIKEESNIVRDFIKKGSTDYNFILKNEKAIAKIIYEQEIDKLLEEKIDCLDELRNNLVMFDDNNNIKNIKIEHRKELYNTFKNIMRRFPNLKKQPFAFIVMMHIFGCDRATKSLKFNKKRFVAYNPIADFNHVRHALKLSQNPLVIQRGVNIHFMSLDSDIDFINKVFIFKEVRSEKLTNYTELSKSSWQVSREIVEENIPNQKNNQQLFHESFLDFYGESF